jgi:hypothetical protein
MSFRPFNFVNKRLAQSAYAIAASETQADYNDITARRISTADRQPGQRLTASRTPRPSTGAACLTITKPNSLFT